MKKKLTINPSDFKKIHTQLQKMEAKNKALKINGLSLSNFFIANVSFDDFYDSPEIRTKRIILQIAGNSSIKPENLPNDIELATNLLYGENEFSLLQMRLNNLVKSINSSKSISQNETDKCETVGDCVQLVNTKIS